MTQIEDIHHKPIEKGSIIELPLTINGQFLFVVLDTNPLDIRYAFNIDTEYEYDVIDLFKDLDFEIVGSISHLL